jgi:4-alpha-glucanotransferase
VNYGVVKRLKWELLELGYGRFWEAERGSTRGAEFGEFCRDEASWLEDYCKFRWLMDLEGGSEAWELWSINYNTPEKAHEWIERQRAAQPEEVERALGFYAWVQWQAFRQWRELKEYAGSRDVKLMGDIPIGISFASADAFFERRWFDLDWSGGAPPERVFKDDAFAVQWGQNWGLPLYRWDVMEGDDFSWWRRRIGKSAGLFHAFRIDHILGFYRIYAFPWRPPRNGEFLGLSPEEAAERTGGRLPGFKPRGDETEENRAANRREGDRYLRMVLAAAGECDVVGEDLGLVPPYVPGNLAELGIAGFRICHWEVRPDGKGIEHPIPGEDYRECSFATYSTHDHPPIAGLWEDFRRHLDDEDEHVRAGARWNLRVLSEFAGLSIPADPAAYRPYDGTVKWKLLAALLATRARYAAFMITDLYGLSDRFNTPATVSERNWSVRVPFTVEEMATREDLKAEAATLRKLIKDTSR